MNLADPILILVPILNVAENYELNFNNPDSNKFSCQFELLQNKLQLLSTYDTS